MAKAVIRRGLELVAAGDAELGDSLSPPTDEVRARAALRTLRSAMDHLEDTEHFEDAHQVLDEAGRRVRLAFGCVVTFDAGQYWDDCRVSLAHNRVGMSIGGVVERAECSICGLDPHECGHVTGRVYDDETCVQVITEVDLDHISLASRPAQPDARIQRVSVPRSDLENAVGPSIAEGADISCDRYLNTCSGVREVMWDNHDVPL